ncbi:CHAT domain-containing protein [Saccharopolyspora antimicrobica]|uniref:CHAT domain-containing protein n=1 Tax=Saccharopolyspora antimicrobica TaxID=455193 RepID=A0A1I4WU58_9PSEU|nr:CHAT domain-containing protein [Saccharopolyspora antimicrobica]RKT82975.1 CHAT domain-containing protein [Saccharopolyspora antimicrobica]SFN16723.1 CHAT domain-containing protein [Saccharopolyspora antimicrobica]
MAGELDEEIAQRYAQLGEELDDETAYQLLVELADLLLQRAQKTGTDVDEVLTVAGSLLEVLAEDSPARAAPLYQLGLAHALRGECGDTAEFRTAVGYLQQLRPLVDDPEIIGRIGLITGQMVLSLTAFEHVDSALADLSTAFEQLPESPLRSQIRFVRGSMHLTRFMSAGGDDSEHRAAVEDLTAGLRELDDPHAVDSCHTGLAYLLLTRNIPAELRHGQLNASMVNGLTLQVSPEELAEAREHLEAIADTSDGSIMMLRTLVSAASKTDESTASDWENAIDDLDRVSRSWDEDLPGRPEIDALQAAMAAKLAEVTGDAEDTDTATARIAEAAAALPADHPMRPLLISGLRATARMSGSKPEDLTADEHAAIVRRLEQALEHFADDDPARAEVITPLASTLLISSAFDRSRQSLGRVRELAEQAVRRGETDPLNAGINHFLLAAAEGVHSINSRDTAAASASVEHLRRADELLPADHGLRPLLAPWLSSLLIQRYMAFGSQEDLEAARYFASGSGHDQHAVARFAEVARHISPHSMDAEKAERMEAELSALLDDLPEDDWLRPRVSSMLGSVQLMKSVVSGSAADPAAADAVLEALDQVPEHHLDHTNEVLGAAMTCIGQGTATRDVSMLNRGIAMMTEVCAKPDLHPRERRGALEGLGIALRARYEITRSTRDLNNAINRFEQILREFEPEPGAFETANLLNSLADSYFTRGDSARRDQQRAVSNGLASLRERARNVLLQNSPRRALETANTATGEATEVSHWCLAVGQPEAAVQALELGRGMVLHASTVEASIPTLLREHGHGELAERWEAEAPEERPWDVGSAGVIRVSDADLPSDLRYRVLRALEPVEAQLLSPPPVEEIAAGLRASATRALVYLLPGVVVLVTADGEVRQVMSPQLKEDGPVARFDQAQRERARGKDVEEEWRTALADVCDWAWAAVLNPVLDLLAGSGPLRIVLVPVGKFGAVPWHAARRRVPGGKVRYACQDAVICYAASARQFLEAGRREARPWDSEPVLVRMPELHWTQHEMGHIHRTHYSHGPYLGKPRDPRRRDRQPPPKPADVLALLPSASMLHLACHAVPAELPVESALLLGSREVLPVQDILRQSRDKPAGALVVLAACASDLTDRQHDEVLTLSTAFLAAGAVGVVGTRWEVVDLPTAMFMIVFHHYLNAGYPDPASALRAAQLWMLDPRRRPLDGIPGELGAFFAEVDPSAPQHWAAFTYQGR